MTWYEDVDRRLDIIENVLARLVRQPAAPEGAPLGPVPERSVPVTTVEFDEDDDLVLTPDPPVRGCTHQHQRYDHSTKHIVCAKCGHDLQASGVVGTDPGADQSEWARAAREGAPDGPTRE